MSKYFDLDKRQNLHYAETLEIISSLSRLFSDSSTPFLHYRVMENLFCECFKAQNLSRSDTAYDAKIGTLGVGLKTFVCTKSYSTEKIAEFNKDSQFLKKINDKRDLAKELATLRNARIQLANDLYDIKSATYHIIARNENKLVFFESDYEKIDITNLQNIKNSHTSLNFSDGKNEYSFNHSKSVLQRKFYLPQNFSSIDIKIIENPFKILLSLKDILSKASPQKSKIAGVDFVVLPLFSMRGGVKNVPEKSGLNQWNARGRKRKIDEVYISVPIEIHRLYPEFFPPRDTCFALKTPLGEILSVKICQNNKTNPYGKALMSNPNSALAKWLLRKILKLKEGELATLDKLENLGFDSVIIEKISENEFSIDIMPLNSYEKFLSQEKRQEFE